MSAMYSLSTKRNIFKRQNVTYEFGALSYEDLQQRNPLNSYGEENGFKMEKLLYVSF